MRGRVSEQEEKREGEKRGREQLAEEAVIDRGE